MKESIEKQLNKEGVNPEMKILENKEGGKTYEDAKEEFKNLVYKHRQEKTSETTEQDKIAMLKEQLESLIFLANKIGQNKKDGADFQKNIIGWINVEELELAKAYKAYEDEEKELLKQVA